MKIILDAQGITHPRLQLLTVQDLLEGKRFQTPRVAARGGRSHQPDLL